MNKKTILAILALIAMIAALILMFRKDINKYFHPATDFSIFESQISYAKVSFEFVAEGNLNGDTLKAVTVSGSFIASGDSVTFTPTEKAYGFSLSALDMTSKVVVESPLFDCGEPGTFEARKSKDKWIVETQTVCGENHLKATWTIVF